MNLPGILYDFMFGQNQKLTSIVSNNHTGSQISVLIRIIIPVRITDNSCYRYNGTVCFFADSINFVLQHLIVRKLQLLYNRCFCFVYLFCLVRLFCFHRKFRLLRLPFRSQLILRNGNRRILLWMQQILQNRMHKCKHKTCHCSKQNSKSHCIYSMFEQTFFIHRFFFNLFADKRKFLFLFCHTVTSP